MDLTKRIRDMMTSEHLMFVYRGLVTSENSIPMLMLLEKEMESSEFGFVGRKRLFMFVLESLQNVARHSDQQRHADMSLVVYSKTETGYTVSTGNILPLAAVGDLKEKLVQINSLQADEIRNVYRQMLGNSALSTKGGAGLGLIEMAKKTGNKLDYDFVDFDSNYSYFVLSKTVNASGVGVHHEGDEKLFHGESMLQLEKLMAENYLFFIWSGHVSSDVEKEVLTFAETRLSEENVEMNIRRRVFSVLVEILENLAKYGPGKIAEKLFGMPVALLRTEGDDYVITTGNLVKNETVNDLRAKLETINKYDKVGLKELFRKSLSGQSLIHNGTGNMGLIDMARKSGTKLVYEFEKVNDEYTYFVLIVKVEGKAV